ncbi:major facilitator superfamily domain-containing protein 4B-like [Haliotis cracherodii]|uniref:major facilitator superfamily domain-containing protein 4B-like n=1 Tax=Haliotis cracherodii TaxID=6455 RepID=UPI0039E9140A
MAEDVSRRSKLIQTFWLFLAFNHRGIQTSFLGPTLLDLQLLLQKDLNSLSYLFFACGLGSMLGALAAGFLASRFDLRLQLFLSLMVGSVSLAAIPQVHHIVYVYIMVFVTGTTSGLVICFVMLLCGELWERKGPPFHFVTCGMSTGAIITPLIARSFLSSRQPVRSDSLSNLTNALSVNATSIGTVLESIISQQDMQDEDTQVQWALFVLGCCILPAGLSQLYYWLVYRSEGSKKKTESAEYTKLNHHELFKLKPIFVAFYVSLFVMYFLISALPVTFSAILTVYGVQGPLHMAKANMLTMTSLFFIGSLSSRIISIFLTRQFTNYQIIITHLSGLVAFSIIFVSLGNRYPMVVWLFSATAGYLSGPCFAGVLAWVTDILSLHPKVTSLCFLCSGAGITLSPFLGGLLYDWYGALSYLYLIFSLIVGMGLMFSCMTVISKALPQDHTPNN